MKLIAICIPVYNRKSDLKNLIYNIISQVTADDSNKIQICISDNDSNDGTDEMVAGVISNNPTIDIVYKKNEKNIGADKNYISCVNLASAKYCWLMGSDDEINEKGLKTVISYIEDKDITVLIGNRIGCTNNMKFMFKDEWIKQKQAKLIDFGNLQEGIQYFNQLNSTTACFGYLSVLVVNKEQWNKVLDYEAYIGEAYVHVYKIIKSLERGGKLLYIPQHITRSRYGNDSFHNNLKQRIFLDFKGYFHIAQSIEDNRLRESFLGIVRRHYQGIFLAVIKSKDITEGDIKLLKNIGFSHKDIELLQKDSILLVIFNLVKMFIRNPRLFYKTTLITLQKYL